MDLTAGYDICVQIHEKMLNKAMALYFYSGNFKIDGEYSIAEKIPAQFKPFSDFKYEITLTKEPFVDFRGRDKLFLRFGSQIKLNIFNCVDVYFSMDFSVDAKITFDFGSRKLQLSLGKAKILNIVAQNRIGISRSFLEKLNYIIDEVVNLYFKEHKIIDLHALPLEDVKLPAISNDLPICQGDVLIFDNQSLFVGLNFFQKGGSLQKAKNCLEGRDCYVAISKEAAAKILDYSWPFIQDSLKVDFDNKIDVSMASAVAGKTTDLLTRVFTLGFIQTNTEYSSMEMSYNGDLSVNAIPGFNFKENNEFEILNLDIDINVNLKIDAFQSQTVTLDKSSIVPDSLTKFEDDVLLSTTKDKPTSLLNTKKQFKVKLERADAVLEFDNEKGDGSILVRITDVDFKIEFDQKGTTFSNSTWENLMASIRKHIINRIPKFTISPSIVLSGVKIFDRYTLSLGNSPELFSTEEGIAVRTDINVNEINGLEADVPNYVVDTASKAVHEFSCEDVYKIPRSKRKGFFVMYEALARGYKPCQKCLEGYNVQ